MKLGQDPEKDILRHPYFIKYILCFPGRVLLRFPSQCPRARARARARGVGVGGGRALALGNAGSELSGLGLSSMEWFRILGNPGHS